MFGYALLLIAIVPALAFWALWIRAGRRWRQLSTRERDRRPRSSFLFSRRGRRRERRATERPLLLPPSDPR